MKIRRITLAVLLLLTVLFVADIRYFGGPNSTKQPSVHFNVSPGIKAPAVEKSQSFVNSGEELSSLVLKGQRGNVELRSTDTDQIVVHATIGADSEEILDTFEVVETIWGSEIRYEISKGQEDEMPEVWLSFVVEVPAGMEVSVEQNFGQVRVHNFRGFLSLNTSFSEVTVWGLEGTASIQSNFGVLDLRKIAGPITLNDSFSTSKVEFLTIDGGYDFDIEVVNGVLAGKAPFQMDTQQNNKLVARGQSGDGVHPVVIRSSFGNVTVNLKDFEGTRVD